MKKLDLRTYYIKVKLELIVILVVIMDIPKLYAQTKARIFMKAIKSAYPNWDPKAYLNETK